jgi:hypothetical protein
MSSPKWKEEGKPEAVVLTTYYTFIKVSSHPKPAAHKTGCNHHWQEKRAPRTDDTVNDKAKPYHLYMLVTVKAL